MMTTHATLPGIALGTWSWGVGNAGGDQIFGHHLDEAELKPVVTAAMANGLNLWDTAFAYGGGDSERILGDLLAPYPRDSYVLSTKFTPQLATNNDAVQEMFAGSLQRLQTDYIDIYWIHNSQDVDLWTPKVIPLLQSGQVKRIGVSNHNLDQLKRADEILGNAGFRVSAVQNHFSLLNQSSVRNGILNYCRNHDITFFSYMVLEQGALTGKYDVNHPLPAGSSRAATYNPMLPQLAALTTAMREIGAAQGASVAEVATAYAIARGTLPIIGVTKAEYIASVKRSLAVKLTEADLAKLEFLAQQTGLDTHGSWEHSI